MRTLTASPSLPLSRYRLLLVLLAALGALLLLSACAEVDDETVVESDGSGVQTLTITVPESDMEEVEGCAAKIESIIKENNPGLTYEGMEKNGTDTVYTMTLEYSDAKDDAAKAQPVLEAGELTPAGDAGTTGVIAFPEASADEIGPWTDAALATEGSTFTYEVAPSSDDPFVVETRVVDSIDCAVACGEAGRVNQSLLLGESTSRSAEDGLVTYTVTAAGHGADELGAALQKIGFSGMEEVPVVSVSDMGNGNHSVYLEIGADDELFAKLGAGGSEPQVAAEQTATTAATGSIAAAPPAIGETSAEAAPPAQAQTPPTGERPAEGPEGPPPAVEA